MSILGIISRHIREVAIELRNKTLNSLKDVGSIQNLGVLQYNSLTGEWTAVAPEEIDAVIDGGLASSTNYQLADIDGGGA